MRMRTRVTLYVRVFTLRHTSVYKATERDKRIQIYHLITYSVTDISVHIAKIV